MKAIFEATSGMTVSCTQSHDSDSDLLRSPSSLASEERVLLRPYVGGVTSCQHLGRDSFQQRCKNHVGNLALALLREPRRGPRVHIRDNCVRSPCMLAWDDSHIVVAGASCTERDRYHYNTANGRHQIVNILLSIKNSTAGTHLHRLVLRLCATC